MTEHAICFQCIEDDVLSAIVESQGEPLLCECCGENENNAFTYERLGEELEPVLREYFEVGPTVRRFYDDDKEGWEQEGDQLSYIVQEVLGQDVDDPDALVDALIAAEHFWPGDGGDAFYDDTQLYVARRATPHAWMAEWHALQGELAQKRRFFSDTARKLFNRLFEDVANARVFDQDAAAWLPVVGELPAETEVFRARVVRADTELRTFLEAPSRELGAPPPKKAVAGRMNAPGIAVFYAALDADTCLAEMRPAIGGRVLVGKFRTKQTLRVLDFRRLEAGVLAKLSYFDSKYSEQRERAVFLRRLHGLISRPVVPGHEDEYLITQTLAEYLAHVHQPAFDCVIFQSVQRQGGANIVLFGRDAVAPIVSLDADNANVGPVFAPPLTGGETTNDFSFPVEYIADSAKLFATRSIEYSHVELHFSIDDNHLFVHEENFDDGDWE
ncbi:RES family NAD+ phosphorylase [Hydrogenophaga luteola]|uniref:RES family NAD+ phosphorylase n=1 Tax=Hydrogenophaga luteola TaxID=1591122 RepID=A0ABV7VYQ6_9BURK